MSAKQYMIVTTKAQPGREEEFVEWYKGTHIPEVITTPGFVNGTLNRCYNHKGEPTGEFQAVYETEAGEPGALFGALIAASPNFAKSDALDGSAVKFTFYLPA